MEVKHDFGEQVKEGELVVWQSPKYDQSRKKAIEMIESNKYGLTDADFWILKNKTRTGKLAYTGLILSHNGCMKINDTLDKDLKFDEQFCSDPIYDTNGMHMIYRDKRDGMYEIGEVSNANCKNDYPYAMLLKRTQDRVILKKSKLAFYGIYSESEIDNSKDETKENVKAKENNEEQKITKTSWKLLNQMYSKDEINAMKKECGVTRGDELLETYAQKKMKEHNDKTNEALPRLEVY